MSTYGKWLSRWTSQHQGKVPPTKEQFDATMEMFGFTPEDVGMSADDEVARVDAGYGSLPGAAEDKATSMAARARRSTCVFCRHGDHEVPLSKDESCDCPCHGRTAEATRSLRGMVQ